MTEPAVPLPVPVALAGCGRIARMFHLPVLARSPRAQLVAVADADPAARKAGVAATGHGTTFGLADWRDLVALPQVEAVVVALPTALHAEVATAALRAGKHVYVEKPLAPDLGTAAEVVRAARASDRLGMMGFNLRAHPLAEALRARVRRGDLGGLVAVRTVFTSAPRELPAWKLRRESGGGALLDLASHHLDMLRFLLDEEIVAVSAVLRSVATQEDTAAITARLSGGALATTLVSTCVAQQDRIELIGQDGTLVWDRMRRRHLAWEPSRGPQTPAERLRAAGQVLREGLRSTVDGLRPPAEPSFAASLERFLAAASGGDRAGLPTLADGLASLAVVSAAERAARTGAEVSVDRDGV